VRFRSLLNRNAYSMTFAPQPPEADDMRRAALSYVREAFAEARLDGLDTDCMAQAALFTAFIEMVSTYGEDATAEFAGQLADRVREGEFTVKRNRH
jgi:hypothetical protein